MTAPTATSEGESMTVTCEQFTTGTDRWTHRTGARFVGPDEWDAGLPQQYRLILHLEAFIEGLREAAADDGTLLDFRRYEFYTGPLSDTLRDEHDEPGWTLKFDRFTSMVLSECVSDLFEAGYLAQRGNGDSVDYRLTLPASVDGDR
jgi:hypothetical protein